MALEWVIPGQEQQLLFSGGAKMEFENFLKELAQVLELEELNENTTLDPEIWNSLSLISVITLIDENYDVRINTEKIQNCNTVKDLLKLIEEEKSKKN